MSKDKKVYAVKVGKRKGIYTTWRQCEKQVYQYPNAEYKSFENVLDAMKYLNQIPGKYEIFAYVDGSYNKEKNIYGYGIVIIQRKKNSKELEMIQFNGNGNEEKLINMWNVGGEIVAAKKAIEYAFENKYKKMKIFYDYQGIAKWAEKQWKTNTVGTIAYRGFVQAMSDYIDIQFSKVDAHTGNYFNEIADKLAKKGCGANV